MSITNARQYRITKAQLRRFEQAIEDEAGADRGHRPESELIVSDILRRQARAQADDLRAQLDDYERLSGSHTLTLEVHSPSDLPSALVHARLAAGLTQKELAEQLGVSPQQVQRDERNGYAHASLERLQRVWILLGARLDGTVTISPRLEDDPIPPAGTGDAPAVREVVLSDEGHSAGIFRDPSAVER